MSILKPRVFWPLTIDSTNEKIYANDGSTTSAGTIAHATYTTPELLLAAVALALQTRLPGSTVTVSETGRVTIEWNGPFTMKFATSPTTQPYAELGFFASDVAATLISAGVYRVTATVQHKNAFYLEQAVMFDSSPIRDRATDTVTRTQNGQTKFITESELLERRVTFGWLPPEKTFSRYGVSTYLNQPFEIFWEFGRTQFKYWEDAATLLGPADYVLSPDVIGKFNFNRQFVRKALYQFELIFWGYVA